ncbi:hypothetical protein B0H19DRAFT_1227781 [Mycena capillaripes]|nr:hypothetical protein B0H19DRAFT_1227781 [Mycena capillaripes]
MSNFSLLFPIHDPCFGDPTNSSSACRDVTLDMIRFLNISNPSAYLEAYCLNPPVDSCAFGYCSNPDVASPAVRTSTIFSIIHRNLTKPHTAVALSLAASPLSVYLVIYVIRSILGNQNRLETVFGKGKWLNRFAVFTLIPIWFAVLVFSVLPEGAWHFQQTACDEAVAGGHVIGFFFISFLVFFIAVRTVVVLGLFAVTWGICVYLQRHEIWKKHNKKLPLRRIWRKVVDAYPFVQFCTVIFIPHLFWVVNIEVGISVLLSHESFTFTYGQLLALLVTIPPLIQLCLLSPRLVGWFIDLTWVRLLTCRRNKPLVAVRRRQQRTASEFTLPLITPSPKSTLYNSARSEESHIHPQSVSSSR